MTDTRPPIRYHDGIVVTAPDEAATIDQIIASMARESEKTSDRYGHAVRASHAKVSGVAVGEMEILPDLPPELRQGLFANAGTHPVVVRFAQGPGEYLKDSVSTHRGMAIKVFGVEGEKLSGHDAGLPLLGGSGSKLVHGRSSDDVLLSRWH